MYFRQRTSVPYGDLWHPSSSELALHLWFVLIFLWLNANLCWWMLSILLTLLQQFSLDFGAIVKGPLCVYFCYKNVNGKNKCFFRLIWIQPLQHSRFRLNLVSQVLPLAFLLLICKTFLMQFFGALFLYGLICLEVGLRVKSLAPSLHRGLHCSHLTVRAQAN